MGKNSTGHIVKGLRGLFRPKAGPRTRSPPPLITSTPLPMVSAPPPVASAPQTPPDPCEKNKSGQEPEKDNPDRPLLDEEVKASIDAQEKMLLAMHRMTLLSYFMADSSGELSEAMIEYSQVFEKRARADPTLSADQVEDNARFRCYSHASKFWGEMSTMQMAVHETLLKDYQYLNRQVASFFERHASDDTGDREIIAEYDKMLRRVERVAGFRLPADLGHVRSKVSEDAHRDPEQRKHARSWSESASRSRHIYVPPRACPVSGLTHGQIPRPIESPAMYPGAFRSHWGELDVMASQNLREASSGDQRFETLFRMRDNLVISFAKKHNDALRDLETDFLTRIAVGLTNTGFDRLKAAYRKTDEWASVVGLQTYAEQLSLGEVQTELCGSLEPSPPRPVIRPGFMGDEWQADYRWGFSADDPINTAVNPGIGRALSPGLSPESFAEKRAEDEDNGSESGSDPISEDPEPGPSLPGRDNPRPPGGSSGSNFASGAVASGAGVGGRSSYSARGPGSNRYSNSNSYSDYAGSGSSYEGNRRFFEGLQTSLPKQMIYELSDNESPSINSDSPSVLSRNSLSTTQTSPLGSDGDLSKSPKGSFPGKYTLATAQLAPEAAITSISPETGTTKVALGEKGGSQKLGGTTFGIIDMPMSSKIVEGLGSAVAQAQYPLVNPFEDTPVALSTLLEDPSEDSVDTHIVMRTGRKHRHLRRVPRFIMLQGGKLKVFGRHNSYTGTGPEPESPAWGHHSPGGYHHLGASASLPDLSAVTRPLSPLAPWVALGAMTPQLMDLGAVYSTKILTARPPAQSLNKTQ